MTAKADYALFDHRGRALAIADLEQSGLGL